jgi:DMSO/TMAO reductase YedYZ molybdopterin-dependent catalytic subunit
MPGLTVSGHVENVLFLHYADLLALTPQIDDVSRAVPGRKGAAVRLASVFEKAAVHPSATHAVLISRDGAFSAKVTLAEIANAVLVYRLSDKPLPEADGGPIRFLNPDAMACEPGNKAACANVKHLGAIELVAAQAVRDGTRSTSVNSSVRGQ